MPSRNLPSLDVALSQIHNHFRSQLALTLTRQTQLKHSIVQISAGLFQPSEISVMRQAATIDKRFSGLVSRQDQAYRVLDEKKQALKGLEVEEKILRVMEDKFVRELRASWAAAEKGDDRAIETIRIVLGRCAPRRPAPPPPNVQVRVAAWI